MLLEWNAPEALTRAKPAFQDGLFGDDDLGGAAILDVDLIAVADGNVAGLGKLATTEE